MGFSQLSNAYIVGFVASVFGWCGLCVVHSRAFRRLAQNESRLIWLSADGDNEEVRLYVKSHLYIVGSLVLIRIATMEG